MHNTRSTSEGRVRRFLREHLPARITLDSAPLSIQAWHAPSEPVPFAEATCHTFTPFTVGESWGRPWGTTWLHVTGEVPENWVSDDERDIELRVNLGFSGVPGFQAEGLIYDPQGRTIKAINPRNQYLTIPAGQRTIDLYLELAANPDVSNNWSFSPTQLGEWESAGEQPIYTVSELHLAWRSRNIWELRHDVEALQGLMLTLPEDSVRRASILACLNEALDAADLDDLHAFAPLARQILRRELDKPASASAMQVIATGHAHIDSAWLWPVRETIRKCARTFSNVCWLLEQNPELTFSCSSAQQFKWIRDHYPELFARIREHVKAGRFIPVGGMWVESDTNMPGSEAMARQFIQGKTFFLREFGLETGETWLPDSFGYSAALPQICALAGHTNFLTQKVSWNQYSTFPHHTFLWEGLDGTAQFTHFPPADDYNCELVAKELAYVESNFKDKGRSSYALSPSGYGDGGGGPTRDHLARAKRFANLEGVPRVNWDSAKAFFSAARAEYREPPRWAGELYLEMHRGTYSSQIRGKQGNRRAESLMRDVELLSALAARRDGGFDYPHEAINSLWERVLLLQFHDILPGSSIAWVHREAERNYQEIQREGQELVERAAQSLGLSSAELATSRANTRSDAYSAVTASQEDHRIQLANDQVSATIDAEGHLVSLRSGPAGRELIAPGGAGALLQLHRDTPNNWDSWDIDEFYRNTVRELELSEAPTLSRDESGEVRVSCTFVTRGGNVTTTEQPYPAAPSNGSGSTIRLIYSLHPADRGLGVRLDVDWHERKKVLKLAFPIDLRAQVMQSEIQFGHIERPIPANTLEDFAKFETCAHRWVRIHEGGSQHNAFALANDSSYGHDVRRHVREDGGTTTIVRATVIRSAEYPDPSAEEGIYTMRYLLSPGASIAEAIDAGERLNTADPLLLEEARDLFAREVSLEGVGQARATSARIETVKYAEESATDLIVRLYESEGVRTRARVSARGAVRIAATDLLERELTAESIQAHRARSAEGTELELDLLPFEIVTLRIYAS